MFEYVQSDLAQLRRRTAVRVEAAEGMPVGPLLVAELARLRAAPMTAETGVAVHALWNKVASWVAAEQMIATADLVGGVRGPIPFTPEESRLLAAQEIACETHIAYPSAMSHVLLVERVAECLPTSWMALHRGELTLAHLKAVAKETRNCSPRVAQAVDARATTLAVERGWTPGETARAARKLVMALDPEGTKDRAAAAKDESDVQLFPQPDEVSTLVANGDAVLGQQMMDAIDGRAAEMARAGDDRAVGVRRFHAMADLVLGRGAGASTEPTPAGRSEVHVRIDLATLMGLNDNPGELIGYGPITADTARKIAADSLLRRLVTDPLTGDTLDLGRRAYRPSAALARLIRASYPTCTAPGCSRPSIRCEIDHRHERHEGGRTDRCNLKPLCKLHHQLKTKKLWRVDLNADGTETWTSYLGRRHTKKAAWYPLPEPLGPDEEIPEHVDDALPLFADPDPPRSDDPLPDPPALTEEQYVEMGRALDALAVMELTYRQWVDKHWDEARSAGLVA